MKSCFLSWDDDHHDGHDKDKDEEDGDVTGDADVVDDNWYHHWSRTMLHASLFHLILNDTMKWA